MGPFPDFISRFFRRCAGDTAVRDVEGPGQAHGHREAQQEKNYYQAADPIGDVKRLEGGIHDLEDDKGHSGIDHGHPEHPAALELGYEVSEVVHHS
ncbi:MAG: hypothetical protein ACETWG_12775 [Candidatus Neomarinimicrobiota bacterium]